MKLTAEQQMTKTEYLQQYISHDSETLEWILGDIRETLETLPLSVALTDPSYPEKLSLQTVAIYEIQRNRMDHMKLWQKPR